MKTINSKQLSFLLKVSVTEADEKIFVAKERKKGNRDLSISRRLFEKGQSIDLKDYEKYYDINLSLAIASIQKDYLKNTATRAWIMDYPSKKLVPNKVGLLPKVVRIPSALKSLLTYDQQEEIINKWNEIYKDWLPVYEGDGDDAILKKEGTVFN